MDFVGRCRGQIKVEISPVISTQVLRKKYSDNEIEETEILPNKLESEISQQKTFTNDANASLKVQEHQQSSKPLWEMPHIPSLVENEDHKAILNQKLGMYRLWIIKKIGQPL